MKGTGWAIAEEFHVFHSAVLRSNGIGLAAPLFRDEERMTRAQWLLLGALGLGLAIVMYVVFFCPADCQ